MPSSCEKCEMGISNSLPIVRLSSRALPMSVSLPRQPKYASTYIRKSAWEAILFGIFFIASLSSMTPLAVGAPYLFDCYWSRHNLVITVAIAINQPNSTDRLCAWVYCKSHDTAPELLIGRKNALGLPGIGN